MPGPAVSLCTVATPLHRRLVGLNHQLTSRLNPSTTTTWLVVDNPDVHSQGGGLADPETMGQIAPGARILQGPSLGAVHAEALAASAAGGDEPERRRLLQKYLGSYHHAAALELAMRHVGTRFVIIMDPDFYVLRPGWIERVLAHMQAEGLAAFGAPWSPRWYQKYRGFPCTHLMVLDLERAPWSAGLLMPDLVGGGRRWASPIWTHYLRLKAEAPAKARGYLLARLANAVREDLRQRRSIGSARDTGFRLAQAAASDPGVGAELLTAVFSPRDGFMPPAVSPLQCVAWIEALAPDARRYVPRRGVVPRGFQAHGHPDVRALGWEEFLWRGEPFAFHVRGELSRRAGGGAQAQVRLRIDAALARLGLPPLDGAASTSASADATA